MGVNYMANPSRVYREYIEQADGAVRADFELGMQAMGLEIVSLIKNLESLPVVTDLGRSEAISALETLLVSLSLRDKVWDLYEFLCEWRRPSFDRAGGGVSVASPQAIAGAGVVSGQGLPPLPASVHDAPGGALLRAGRLRALPEVHRDPRAWPIVERGARTFEEVEGTWTSEDIRSAHEGSS